MNYLEQIQQVIQRAKLSQNHPTVLTHPPLLPSTEVASTPLHSYSYYPTTVSAPPPPSSSSHPHAHDTLTSSLHSLMHQFAPPPPSSIEPVSATNPFQFVPSAATPTTPTVLPSSSFSEDYMRIKLQQAAEANARQKSLADAARSKVEEERRQKRELDDVTKRILQRSKKTFAVNVEQLEGEEKKKNNFGHGEGDDDPHRLDDDDSLNDAPMPLAMQTVKPRVVTKSSSSSASSSSSSTRRRLLGNTMATSLRASNTARWIGRQAVENEAKLATQAEKRLQEAKARAIRREGIALMQDAEARKAKMKSNPNTTTTTNSATSSSASRPMTGAKPGTSSNPINLNASTSSRSSNTLSARTSISSNSSSTAVRSSSSSLSSSVQRPSVASTPLARPSATTSSTSSSSSSSSSASSSKPCTVSHSSKRRRHESSSDSSSSDSSSDSDSGSESRSARLSLRDAKKQRTHPSNASTQAPSTSVARDNHAPSATTTPSPASSSSSIVLPPTIHHTTSTLKRLAPPDPYAALAASAKPIVRPTQTPVSLPSNVGRAQVSSSTASTPSRHGISPSTPPPASVPSPLILPVIPLPHHLASRWPISNALRQTFVDSFIRLAIRIHPDQFDADQLHPSLPGNALLLRSEWQLMEHVIQRTEGETNDVIEKHYKTAAGRVLTLMKNVRDIVYVAEMVAKTKEIEKLEVNKK